MPCLTEDCGTFLFVKSCDGKAWAWATWTENSAFWSSFASGYPRDFVQEKFQLNGDAVWRHIAVQYNEVDNSMRLFYDGRLAYKGPWGSDHASAGSDVKKADCNGANARLNLGRTEPGWKYGAETEVFDLRMYKHAVNAPLSAADIFAIANDAIPAHALPYFSDAQCLRLSDVRMEDQGWADVYGNTCEWYAKMRKKNPQVCAGATVRSKCPQACESRQECLDTTAAPPTYFVWDRITRVEGMTENGTVCLSSRPGNTAREVVERCREWVKGKENLGNKDAGAIRNWWASVDPGTEEAPLLQGKRLNVTDCDELAASIDDECSFRCVRACVRAPVCEH